MRRPGLEAPEHLELQGGPGATSLDAAASIVSPGSAAEAKPIAITLGRTCQRAASCTSSPRSRLCRVASAGFAPRLS